MLYYAVSRKIGLACCLLLVALLPAQRLSAQEVVRFVTNAGPFDVTLNPTSDPNLQGLVDNFLQNVDSDVYDGVVINRAVQDFVVQLGSFSTDVLDVGSVSAGGFAPVSGFSPEPVDADGDGLVDFPFLSNTRGEVALALSAAGPNSGSVSFFVNLVDNGPILDQQGFVPFARVEDLSFFDGLANGVTVDVSTQVGAFPGSLAFSDVPVVNGDQLVLIQDAFVVPEPSSLLMAGGVLVMGLARRRGAWR